MGMGKILSLERIYVRLSKKFFINENDYDRKPDLVVGAPFYVDEKDSGGAAYVYLNNHGFRKNHPYVRLSGPRESRFGIALSTSGDLNKDGFEDLAVGAPYADEGYGSVYIFLGSKDGIIKDPTQVMLNSTGSLS